MRHVMPRMIVLASVLSWIPLAGCTGGWRYYGDPSSKLEEGRYEYAKTHPGEAFNNEILAGKIREGMGPQHVRASWGRPDRTLPGDQPGIHQVWLYVERDPSRGKAYYILRFAGEELTDIEQVHGNLPLAVTENLREELPEKEIRSTRDDKPYR